MLRNTKIETERRAERRSDSQRGPTQRTNTLQPAISTTTSDPEAGGLALAGAYAARQLASAVSSRGGALSASEFSGIEDFIQLEPKLGDEQLRPPTFPNLKRPQPDTLAFPRVRLEPANLLGPVQVSAAFQMAAVAGGENAAVLPEPDDPFRQTDRAMVADQLEQPEALSEHLEFAATQPAERLVLDPEDSENEELAIEDDSIFDSPMPFREHAPRRPRSPWQAIEAFFLSRGFSQLVAACVVILFVSTLNVPWRHWFTDQVEKVKEPLTAVMEDLSRPIKERSAFFIVDDFTEGVDHWLNNESMIVNDAGLVRVSNGLALHGETMNLESYRLDFEAQIQSKAVGWVVRAADTNNHYAFKLVESGSKSFDLMRYAVIDGAKDSFLGAARIDLPANLAQAGEFNRISVRVREDQITTLINGWGVDFWRDERIERGGIGLLASRGESSLVRKMSISGNEDTWGLILYGTLETMKSVRSTFSAPVAIVLQPVPVGTTPFFANNQTFLLTSGL